MRLFELLIILSLLLVVLSPFVPAKYRTYPTIHQVLYWLPCLPFLFVLPHLIIEKYRWQMFPIYTLVVVILLMNMFNRRRSRPLNPHPLMNVIACLGIGLLAIPPILVPVPNIAPLTGTYGVGTFTAHLIDTNRPDPLSTPAGQPRELMMQVWYPTAPNATGEHAPYVNDIEVVSKEIATRFGMPAFFLNHIPLTHPHARLNVPMATQPNTFPLLLFSHGLGGIRTQNTYQVEQLVSHGYVVAAVDHTYSATITVLPPDHVVFFENQFDTSSIEAFEQSSNAMLQVWEGDLNFMLNILTAWQQDDPQGILTNRLDLEKVGLFGHSTGGGAMIEFCAQDVRCRVGLSLDGWFQPVSSSVFEQTIDQPFMLMGESGDFFTYDTHEERIQYIVTEAQDGYWLEIAGTEHFDFTDMPLISPLTDQLDLTGTITPRRMHEIVNAYSLAFFDQYLKGIPSSLLSPSSSPYPEVTFEHFSE